MKVRKYFVSNSSSSSFIVHFKTIPETLEQMQEMLFGDAVMYMHPYPTHYRENSWPVEEIADIVFSEFKDQEPISHEEILEDLCCGHHEMTPRYDLPRGWRDMSQEEHDEWYEEHDRKREEASKTFLERFLKRFPEDAKFFRFSYSDNDGSLGCSMEHGDLFDKVECMRISHH